MNFRRYPLHFEANFLIQIIFDLNKLSIVESYGPDFFDDWIKWSSKKFAVPLDKILLKGLWPN